MPGMLFTCYVQMLDVLQAEEELTWLGTLELANNRQVKQQEYERYRRGQMMRMQRMREPKLRRPKSLDELKGMGIIVVEHNK